MKTQERSRPAERSDAQIAQDVVAWLAGRLPDPWLRSTPQVSVDRDEILIAVALEAPAVESEQAADRAAADHGGGAGQQDRGERRRRTGDTDDGVEPDRVVVAHRGIRDIRSAAHAAP